MPAPGRASLLRRGLMLYSFSITNIALPYSFAQLLSASGVPRRVEVLIQRRAYRGVDRLLAVGELSGVDADRRVIRAVVVAALI